MERYGASPPAQSTILLPSLYTDVSVVAEVGHPACAECATLPVFGCVLLSADALWLDSTRQEAVEQSSGWAWPLPVTALLGSGWLLPCHNMAQFICYTVPSSRMCMQLNRDFTPTGGAHTYAMYYYPFDKKLHKVHTYGWTVWVSARKASTCRGAGLRVALLSTYAG